ncbi:alpha/beta fold hydrolase [Leptolyngbya ohadii]|uniref:alpha/beta fold hydrolase n=1 Tax=Leptolyngbya ohadii TaxID=1962290 RepID=UPI000B59E25E|nr:alpha/beta hydrolase [Leptolyngbya ohadii]
MENHLNSIADFLPVAANQIRDSQAITFLNQIQRQTIQITFLQSITAIDTAFIHSNLPATRSNISPILFLHGFDSSLLEFRRVFPLLSTQHHLWAIDLYGSGFTAFSHKIPVNPQTIRLHLHQTIATLIREPIILIGASLGGAVAIDFAVHYPDLVKALVLIDSVGFSGSFPLGQYLPVPLLQLGTVWLNFRKQAALNAISLFPTIDPQISDDLRCSLLHQEMPGWSEAILSFTQSGGYGGISDRIPQITQPTLILWGKQDDILGTGDAEKFRQSISGSQLTWTEQAKHSPHLDQPQQVADRILAFCRTQIS